MAIKSLTTLIKLHKRHVDVLRREMVALEEERRQLLQLEKNLQEEHGNEMHLAVNDPRVAGFFGVYSARMKARLHAVACEIQRLNNAIEEKIEAIREEYSEEKKYDIARGHIFKRLENEEHIKQQHWFDEIAGQMFFKEESSK